MNNLYRSLLPVTKLAEVERCERTKESAEQRLVGTTALLELSSRFVPDIDSCNYADQWKSCRLIKRRSQESEISFTEKI
jgi:hypothetical protein